jgi:hypothetical protein
MLPRQGSSFVDKRFMGWRGARVGEGAVQAWAAASDNGLDVLELRNRWELTKCEFTGSGGRPTAFVPLPGSLVSAMTAAQQEVLEEEQGGRSDR